MCRVQQSPPSAKPVCLLSQQKVPADCQDLHRDGKSAAGLVSDPLILCVPDPESAHLLSHTCRLMSRWRKDSAWSGSVVLRCRSSGRNRFTSARSWETQSGSTSTPFPPPMTSLTTPSTPRDTIIPLPPDITATTPSRWRWYPSLFDAVRQPTFTSVGL